MTLTDRILIELDRLGSRSHPIARCLPRIEREHCQVARFIHVVSVLLALVVGFLTCYAWMGVRVEVLSSNVAAWKDQSETDWRTHHQVVKVNERQARGLIGRREREEKP